jgi:hypothetical protein
MTRKPVVTIFGMLLLTIAARGEDADFAKVPGVVVDHSPASTGVYLGSAGIAILPDGAYLTKCDEFGPKSSEHQRAVTRVHRSDDRGKTWRPVARIDGLFWANVFTHNGAAYLLGTEKHHGRIVIMRSDDGGQTWSEPTDEQQGLLTSTGQYHTAPMPMVVHDGRIWRAFEDASGGLRWGSRYQAGMMSVPVDADLLKQSNWTFSNVLPSNPLWLGGVFGGWLEGNAVVTPQGDIVNILRIACPSGGKAAMVRVSKDGKTVRFDPDDDIVDFPGGAKKFTIRYDEQSQAYWTLSNPVMPKHAAETKAASIRNTLALMCSMDLRSWQIRCVLIYHPDVRRHGFQYPDWLFEGDDVIAAIRTAYDDGLGGAHNAHDANFLTFHRFADFRKLTMADSVVDPEEMDPVAPEKFETAALNVEGRGFELATLDNDATAFGNRTYVWQDVPAAFRGWRYTQTNGGQFATIAVTAKQRTTLFAATTRAMAAGISEWSQTEDGFLYTDRGRTEMQILRRDVEAGQTITLPQGGWTSTLLLIPPAEE